jgi:hypothetical protein
MDMNTQLQQQRQDILNQMQSIHRLRRGSLSRQVFTKHASGKSVNQGPYFLLQGFVRGQKFSQRIPAVQAAQVQQDVDNYKRFQALAEQFVAITDQITRLETSQPDAKKNSNRPKSPGSSSGKPKPS